MTLIAVAGATGDLGSRVVSALQKRGAAVRALVRPESAGKLTPADGLEVVVAERPSREHFVGVTALVSTLNGLGDVIIDAQRALLDAAVSAGVPHFLPSDYCSDYDQIPVGQNRNFDLRRAFFKRLWGAPIRATSVRSGAFAELLGFGLPFFDTKNHTVGYWEDADRRVDFTAKDDVAAFTASVALDPEAPQIVRVAGFQISANEMAALATELSGTSFATVRLGSLAELAAANEEARAADPDGERALFPSWQRGQYLHSMFSSHLAPLDNQRYPEVMPQPARVVVARVLQQRRAR